MKPELSIIIVNWNGIDFLPDCLRCIGESPPRVPYEVVVVDNDSSDGSLQWLRSDEPSKLIGGGTLVLINSGENLGFGRANNLAFEATSSRYLFLLNPDTQVKAAAIDNLIAALNLGERIGMSVPKVVALDGSIQRNVWYIPSALRFLSEGLRVSKIVPEPLRSKLCLSNEVPRDATREVPLASGCAMMVAREMIFDVGGFDPDIFMFGEDAEWCYRIGKRGWKIIFEPSAEVIHIGGQSSVQKWGELETRVKEEEAFLKFAEMCLSTPRLIALLLVRVLLTLPPYLLSALKKKENVVKRAVLIQLGGLKRAFRKLSDGAGF